MQVVRIILVVLTFLMLGCVSLKQDAWYQHRQSELVAGQNETLDILSNTSSGEFNYEGTISEVIERLNVQLKDRGINVSVVLDLDMAKEFSPDPEGEISELLQRSSSGSVKYENLQFLFYDVIKSYGFVSQFVKGHVVITPKRYTSLYTNANRHFEPSVFSEENSNLMGIIGYMNYVISDEELVIDPSYCQIPENPDVDKSIIVGMTFLDAIRFVRDRLDAEAVLTEEDRLILRCSEMDTRANK